MSVLPPPEEKAAYVRRMFATIAPTYDRINRIMTLGQDQGWRRHLVEAVAPPAGGQALDIGTGTGDFLPLLAAKMGHGLVVGADPCVPMMQSGLSKGRAASVPPGEQGCHIAFMGGDTLALPFPDQSFDAITTGFTMRNVTDIDAALREMERVARPGCVMACLEVARPQHRLLRRFHRWYVSLLVPWIGGVLSGNRQAYVYLDQSMQVFPSPDVLAHKMQQAGWNQVQYRLYSLGAVAIHRGVK